MSERLEFNGKVNKYLNTLIADYMEGKITAPQLRKFVAKNEISFDKLIKFFENDNVVSKKNCNQSKGSLLCVNKKKTPNQRNGLGYSVK